MKHTLEELQERIHQAEKEDLVGMMTLILRMRHTDATRKRLESIILGDENPKHGHYANICLDRTVTIGVLKDLAASPMMDYVDAIIEAALMPEGPFQSREVLVQASSLIDGKPYYINAHQGITRRDLTLAGYILSMAGFERRSHFDKERRTPVKAWKPRRGTGQMTVKQRADLVKSIMKMQLEPKRTPMINSLGGLI